MLPLSDSKSFALGFIGAMALGTTAPVNAQGIYLNGPGGFSVGVGSPGYYQQDRGPRYYDYSPGTRDTRAAAGILGTAARLVTPYRAVSVSRIADHPVAAGRAPSQL